MSNQTENKMNVLFGICAAPMIDGIYSFCESKETITDLYTVLHALYECSCTVKKQATENKR